MAKEAEREERRVKNEKLRVEMEKARIAAEAEKAAKAAAKAAEAEEARRRKEAARVARMARKLHVYSPDGTGVVGLPESMVNEDGSIGGDGGGSLGSQSLGPLEPNSWHFERLFHIFSVYV